MNKLKKIYSIVIILFPITLVAMFQQFFYEEIVINSLSKDYIFRGYEQNLFDNKVVILVEGKGFKEGDYVFLNGYKQVGSVANDTTLSFFIPDEIYEDTDTIKVQIKRLNSSNKVIGKSNECKIKVYSVVEDKNNSNKIIESITPTQINVRETENLIDNMVPISIIGKGFNEQDRIYINNEPQQTAFGNSELLTCLIPRKFYSKPGVIQVQVKQTPTLSTGDKNVSIDVTDVKEIAIVRNESKLKADANIWYENSDKIMHAMGSIGGKAYTNSYEAFLHNYELGHRVFEVDLTMTSDNRLVARHDWSETVLQALEQDKTLVGPMDYETFKNAPINGKLTAMGIEDIIKIASDYPDIWIVTNTKDTEISEVKKQFTQIVEVAQQIDSTVLDRIVPQIYNPEMLDVINNIYEWKNPIYTLYQSKETQDEIIASVKKYNIKVVTMPEISATQAFIDKLLDENIYVFVHTINDKQVAKKYFDMGVYGVYTDVLEENIE